MPIFSDLIRVSLTQYVVVLLMSLGFFLFSGSSAGVSALLGGLAYAIPSTVLALFIATPKLTKKDYKASPYRIFLGEFVKILIVILLWGIAVSQYENLHWPAFIFTIIAVANSYFVILFKKN